tara:strand:- start:1058 stop:1663 length:606 start_codon:yes stop_codon:yes gene_type:complete
MIIKTKPSFIEEYAKTSGIITEISEADVRKARDWSIAVAEAKAPEAHQKADPRKRSERFFTGMLGELAISYLLEKDFIDWGIGPSAQYKKADLSGIGLNVGIKTVRHPDNHPKRIEAFPLVSQKPKCPEIINVKLSDNKINTIGVVGVEHLKTYARIDLVNDTRARTRKAGFYNLSVAKPFKSLEELKCLVLPDYWPIDWS